jgi:hypothetical protein
MLNLQTYQTPQDFLDKAETYLLKDEAKNSLMYGVIRRLHQYPEIFTQKPFLSTIEDTADEKGLMFCATMTPPNVLILTTDRTDYADALPLIATALLDEGWNVPGAMGEKQLAKDFVEVWAKISGESYRLNMNEKLYKLTQVTLPAIIPPGKFRLAEEKDIPLVADWFVAFTEEALTGEKFTDPLAVARMRVETATMSLWEEETGEVVSLSGFGRPTLNGINVGPVYTPPELRGKGYASALVAILSQHLLDRGYQYVTLYTDLANPISNGIYQKIGYKPICDFDMYFFDK